MTPTLRLGAFDVALDACAPTHVELLEGLFRTRARDRDDDRPAHLRLALRSGNGAPPFGNDDALVCTEADGLLALRTDVIAGHLERGPEHSLSLWVRDDHSHARYLDHYLRIVLNAVLRRLGRIRLPAAAVELDGSVSLFVGDKGAGKTTLSLHLARAGGVLLGEDQIMVRRREAGDHVVAGGDDMMRVTARTEARFFPEPLPEPVVLLAGVEKKEIAAASYLTCRLDEERPPERVFFPAVGEAFRIRPLGGREALARLAAPLRPIHRFTDAEDRREFLSFLARLVRQTESFELTLSEDLNDLDHLVAFLR